MKNIAIEVKWALVLFALMLAWVLLEQITGLHNQHIDKHGMYANLITIPTIAAYVLALLEKRKTCFNGAMSYGEAFNSGFILTFFVTALNPIVQYIFIEVVSPGYFERLIPHMVSSGIASQQEAEAYLNLESYIKQGLISTPISGIIITAIVAIFVQGKST